MTEALSDLLDDQNSDKFVQVIPNNLFDAFNANEQYEPAAGQSTISLLPNIPRQFTKLVIGTTIPIKSIEAVYENTQAAKPVGFAVSDSKC